MSHRNQLSVPQINTPRLRAVQLRIGGSTLKAISLDTGLSSPTIIAAYRLGRLTPEKAVDRIIAVLTERGIIGKE